MLTGKRTWIFETNPIIISTGVIGGPFEKKGAIPDDFDAFYEDQWFGEDSYEKAQKVMFENACETSLQKAGLTKDNVQFVFAGDLLNQITSTSFACRKINIPYFGLFSACATSMEGLALAAFIINGYGADTVMTGSASHYGAVEKTFRYPNDYGAQKPPTAQRTTTAAGAAILSKTGNGPAVTSATIGKVVDKGLKDPFNMGGAMAPAAVDTIEAHLQDRNITPEYYDLIVTGDLAMIGRSIALELFEKKGIPIRENQFHDCGLLLYKNDQNVMAGASGSGCSAAVTYGHLLNRMRKGELNKILVVATGALLSPLTFQQQETIPCIAHAVSIEMQGGKG